MGERRGEVTNAAQSKTVILDAANSLFLRGYTEFTLYQLRREIPYKIGHISLHLALDSLIREHKLKGRWVECMGEPSQKWYRLI